MDGTFERALVLARESMGDELWNRTPAKARTEAIYAVMRQLDAASIPGSAVDAPKPIREPASASV